MEIYILRHGAAFDRDPEKYKDDSLRPLTKKGGKKMEKIAWGMRKLGVSFDIILSSPFARAKQTAEIVARIYRSKKKLTFSDSLAVGGTIPGVMDELIKEHGEKAAVLLVGHEPFLSLMISELISGGPGAAIVLKKGGLAKLSAPKLEPGRCASLEWILTPGQLSRLG